MGFKYRMKSKFNYIYIRKMNCKIVRSSKLWWQNIMKSTNNQMSSI